MRVKEMRSVLRYSGLGLLIVALLGGVLWIGSALIEPPPMRPPEYYANVTVLGPSDRTLTLGAEDQDVRFLISGVRGLPRSGEEVTFTILSGPASLAEGSERTASSSQGVAEIQDLELTGTGTFTVEVEIEMMTKQFDFEIVAP